MWLSAPTGPIELDRMLAQLILLTHRRHWARINHNWSSVPCVVCVRGGRQERVGPSCQI